MQKVGLYKIQENGVIWGHFCQFSFKIRGTFVELCSNMKPKVLNFLIATINLKPNFITLASSELAPNMFEASSCQIPYAS